MKKTTIGKLKLNKETLKILTGREEALLKEVRGGVTSACQETDPNFCTGAGFCDSSLCASNQTVPCEATTRWDTCICPQC